MHRVSAPTRRSRSRAAVAHPRAIQTPPANEATAAWFELTETLLMLPWPMLLLAASF